MTAGDVTEAPARSQKPAERRKYRMLIGGEWVEARSGETFESVDPFTGRPGADIPRAGPEEVDAAGRGAAGRHPARGAGSRRRGGARGARGVRRGPVAGDVRHRARAADAAPRRADR